MDKRSDTDQGRRYPLNMRSTRGLRDKIEAAAQLSGRSMAHEVEFRLEMSFVFTDVRQAIAAGYTDKFNKTKAELTREARAEWESEWEKKAAPKIIRRMAEGLAAEMRGTLKK